MFEKLRKPLSGKKIFAPIIFGAICLTFVFVGMNPDGALLRGGAVAEVNNASISFKSYQEAVNRMEEVYRERLGGIPEAQRQSLTAGIKGRALEQLIEREVLGQELQREGIYSSDVEIRERIAKIPSFQRKGRFQHEIYTKYLAAVRESSSTFEDKVRRDIAFTKIQSATKTALVPLDMEMDRIKELKQTKINIEFVEYDKSKMEKGYKVSPSEVSDYLAEESNQALLKTYYDGHLADFTKKAKVRASHLLIKTDAKDPKSEVEALKKIKELQAKITLKNFAEMAAKHSEDVGSKIKKGDLGFIDKGRMVPPFEKAVFAKKEVGLVSEPVKTQFGYHLIYVTERKDEIKQKLAQVSKKIAEKLILQKMVKAALDDIKKWVKAKEHGKLGKMMKKFSLKWDNTGEFALDQSYIAKLSDPEKILEVVLKYREMNVILPEIVESRGKSYLLKNVAVKKTAAAKKKDTPLAGLSGEEASKQSLADRRAGEFIDGWIKQIKKQSKVTRHLPVDSLQL